MATALQRRINAATGVNRRNVTRSSKTRLRQAMSRKSRGGNGG